MDIKNITKQHSDLKKEIARLEKESILPETLSDPSRIKTIAQLLATKKMEYTLFDKVVSIKRQIDENENMLEQESDPDMKAFIEEELATVRQQYETSLEALQNELNQDPRDKAPSVILEIRAGTGGEEAALFAADLFRMYAKFAEAKNWSVTILSEHHSDTGGFKEIIVEISGERPYYFLKYENGVHRVQRIPVTEASGRIHTSAASVVAYPMVEEEEVDIDPNDIRVDVYRSSGPGGQSVNRTDSAVRMTHIPTGIVVTCQDEKSQLKNKKKALSILKSKIADIAEEKRDSELSTIRKSAISTGDRSAKIRTYNYPQNRVTDHRIKKSWHYLKLIMDGDIGEIIEDIRNVEESL